MGRKSRGEKWTEITWRQCSVKIFVSRVNTKKGPLTKEVVNN